MGDESVEALKWTVYQKTVARMGKVKLPGHRTMAMWYFSRVGKLDLFTWNEKLPPFFDKGLCSKNYFLNGRLDLLGNMYYVYTSIVLVKDFFVFITFTHGYSSPFFQLGQALEPQGVHVKEAREMANGRLKDAAIR